MKTIDILIVKIYIMESSTLLKSILKYLKTDVHVRGVSVFRAVSGYGDSGNHTSSLMDLALDLPLSIEFFDETTKVEAALEYLNKIIKPEHIVFWEAKANL